MGEKAEEKKEEKKVAKPPFHPKMKIEIGYPDVYNSSAYGVMIMITGGDPSKIRELGLTFLKEAQEKFGELEFET